MYYYCNRNKMSARAAGPAAEGRAAGCPQRGDGLLAAGITREAEERADSVTRGRCCRQSGGASEDRGINIDDEEAGGVRRERRCFTRATARDQRRASARLPPVRSGRAPRGRTESAIMTARCGHGNSEPAVIKRRGCSFTRTSKRVCFSGTSSGTYCGSSDAEARVSSNGEARMTGTADSLKPERQVNIPAKRRASLRRIQCENTTGVQTSPCLPDSGGGHGVENTELPVCRTAKQRVRARRVRACLSGSANHNSRNNNPSLQPLQGPQTPEPEHEKQHKPLKTPQCAFAISSSHGESAQVENGPPDATTASEVSEEKNSSAECESTAADVCTDVASGSQSSSTQQIEAVRNDARRRQAELEGRTDHLWKRLQAVQVKQVEGHIGQQLRELYRSPRLNCTRRPSVLSRDSVELSRLAHSSSEILRTAESTLDSDHTASSSGGDSDSEEDDEALERGHRLRPPSTKSVVAGREWQWAESRAWLGSRWVWLQTQVSELEYRIRALTELYTHLRQGKVRSGYSHPDTPLGPSKPPITSNNCRKWHTEDTPSTLQTAPSPPSSAARVRPLPRQRCHRLIRLDDCAALRSKAVSLQCWCESSAVCVLCASAPRCSSEKEKGVCMRQAQLDMSVHPVLSMPSDSPLALHCGKPPLVGHHNSVQWADTSSWLGRRGQGRVGRVRRRLVCPRPPGALPPLFNTPGGSGCRSQRDVISPNCLPPRALDLPTLPSSPSATDTPAQPLRRRRTESSFDIDNLVMPQGLAGLGARVQRLQYKEIVTPSWRELDSLVVSKKQDGSESQTFSDNNTNLQPSGDELENEVEDLSDAVFLSRHAACEGRERSRRGSWAHRRRRGRSSSSCYGEGKSSRGLETPGSPDSRQSHCTEEDVSPRRPFCAGADDLSSQTEDEQPAVLPWEHRLFPLQDSELHWLQEEEEAEPDEDPCTASSRSQSTDSGISVGSLELSPRTPQPSQQHSGTEQIPHTLFHKPATPATVSPAQDSHTLTFSSTS